MCLSSKQIPSPSLVKGAFHERPSLTVFLSEPVSWISWMWELQTCCRCVCLLSRCLALCLISLSPQLLRLVNLFQVALVLCEALPAPAYLSQCHPDALVVQRTEITPGDLWWFWLRCVQIGHLWELQPSQNHRLPGGRRE